MAEWVSGETALLNPPIDLEAKMAKRRGTPNGESLFGTRKDDLIFGKGGDDTLSGLDGNDIITGFGEIFGGSGNDRYFAVGADRGREGESDFGWIQPDFEMGSGNDTVVLNHHDHFLDQRVGFGGNPESDLGKGKDKIVIAGDIGGTVILGKEADEVYAMSLATTYRGITFYVGGRELASDKARDVVSFDGHGTIHLIGFGRNDVLKIYGSKLSPGGIRARTDFESDTLKTNLRILLDDGAEISINKDWSGPLSSKQIKTFQKPLHVVEKVYIANEEKPTKVLFGSGGDDRLKAKKKMALFMGDGDDRGVGDNKGNHIRGESGDDFLNGRGGNDLLRGGTGDDRIIGGNGRDTIFTGSGNDVAIGGGGADLINVGAGADTAFGGSGADTFVFNSPRLGTFGNPGVPAEATGGSGRDTFAVGHWNTRGTVIVNDFDVRKDRIDFSGVLENPSISDKQREVEKIIKSIQEISITDTSAYDIDGTSVSGQVKFLLVGVDVEEFDETNLIF